MARFRTKLRLEVAEHQDNGKWIVLDPLVYESDVAGQTFAVPSGFLTDLASVPRLPLAYWLTGSTSNEAAVIHDYLYVTRCVERSMADKVLREASALTGVPAWRRGIMWAAVRLFGGAAWASREDAMGRPVE